MHPAYISKINSNWKKTNNSIIDSKRRKSRMVLSWLRGVISKNHGDFYCLNCLHSFRIENKLKSYEKVCKIEDFCDEL